MSEGTSAGFLIQHLDSSKIKKMYYSQMINIQDQVSLETSRNEDPIASPGNLFNCLITLAVNFPLSQAKISPLN